MGATLAILIALAACGSTGPAPDAAVVDAGTPIAPPVLSPCPLGWRETAGGTCDPWPEGGRRDDCAEDEMHLPGTAGCAPIGPACPEGGWPASLPADRTIVYVDAAAAAGGDGTAPERAIASLEDAVAIAPEGSVISIRAGRYEVTELAPGTGVTLIGACVAGTRVTSPLGTGRALLRLDAPGAGARALAIDRPETLGVFATGEGTSLEEVLIVGALGGGIETFGGSLRVHRVAIRDLRADEGIGGEGIDVDGGAIVTVSETAIERTPFAGILALAPGTSLDARDVVIAATLSREIDRSKGRGVDVEAGAAARIERVVIDRARDVGLFVASDGTRCEARDVVITDTQPEERSGEIGLGASVNAGGTLILERTWLLRDREIAVDAFGGFSVLEARDVVIEDTLPRQSDGSYGIGIAAGDGAVVRIARARVIGSRSIGALVSDLGSLIEAEDLTIDGVSGSERDGQFGSALWAQLEGVMAVTRATLSRSRTAGVAALTGASVTLADVSIRDVAPAVCAGTTCPERAGGFGVSAHLGARVEARRFEVAGAAVCGVVVGAESSMDLETGVVRDAPVGACVQIEGYDTARLQRGVEYRDVGIPLQATTYALPDQDAL